MIILQCNYINVIMCDCAMLLHSFVSYHTLSSPKPNTYPFEELQGWNLELKLITPISIGSHFESLAIYPQIYHWQKFWNFGCHLGFFQNSIYQPFDDVQGSNSEYKLITHISISGSPLEIWWPSWILTNFFYNKK